MLWTAPRSVSTAFEFSIRTLHNAKVFHEPYCLPYYIAKPLAVPNWTTESGLASSYEEVGDMLKANYPGKDIIFAKNHAYTVEDNFKMFLDESFSGFTHSFLIRDPAKAVASSFRGFPSLEAWSEVYRHGDLGYYQLRDLYKFIKENLHCNPIIIDADDLLRDPEAMMKAYCKEVGIEYKEGMTQWEPDSMCTEEFIEQKGGLKNVEWNKSAIKSSGISQNVGSRGVKPDEEFPEIVVKCIEEFRVVYNELYPLRFTPI